MSYSPLYTSEVQIEGLLQLTIDANSIPTTTQLNTFIEQVETEVVQRRLGSHTATDIYLDVGPGGSIPARYNWVYNARTGTLRIDLGKGVVVPLINVNVPVISITTLEKNDNSPDAAPSWDSLTEYDGSSASDFMLLKGGSKQLGYALYIYDNMPFDGPMRLKMTYTYGHNVDSIILGEYCMYGAAIKALQARWASNSPSGLSVLEGDMLGTYIPRQYAERIGDFRFEMIRIEAEHFPRDDEFGAEVV